MEKVNSTTLSTLVVSLSGAPFWGILGTFLVNTSKNATLISLIIGFIISLIMSFIILKLFSKYENLTITNRFKYLFGKLSIVFNILFIICSLAIYIFLTFRLTNFLSSQYLIETPIIYFFLLILCLTFYISSKGIETISRVALLSFYIGIILFIFDIFSLAQYIDINNYLPVFNVGIKEIVKSSLVFSMYFSIPTVYVTIIKKNQISDKKRFNKMYFIMYITSFLILLSAIGITIGTLGTNLMEMFDYPLYTVLKRIKLFSFLDSIENISIMIWILYLINATSIIHYSVVNSIKETFNIRKNIFIYIVLFIASLAIPYLFLSNNNFTSSFEFINIPLIFGGVVLLLLIVSLFKKNKNS